MNLFVAPQSRKRTKVLTWVYLLIILVIAGFFRLWQLNSIPSGLYPDEAINGNNALSALKSHSFKVFYPENNGREGLFVNLISLSFSVFGISIWSIRIVSAIIGILTVPGLYLLTKELFQVSGFRFQVSRSIALVSSFFLAISFWHINFSRIGFRGILVPFILVFSFYFLLNGLKNQRRLPLIIGGIFFGLGFYTYTVFRLAVLLLFLVLLFWFFTYKKQKLMKIFLLSAFCFLLSAFIAALPIGIYFLQNPEDFLGRASGVSIFSQNFNPPFSQLQALGLSFIKHLGMFNFAGDFNWRHNLPGSPQLLWPIGVLFLIGFFISAKKIFKKSNWQSKTYQSLFPFYFLLSAFFTMLLPSILTFEGIPHALRSIGVIPAIYIFSALGYWYLYQWLNLNIKNKKLVILCWTVFLLTIGILQYDKYFIKWAKNPEVKNAFSENYVEMGKYLNSISAKVQKYVIANQPGVPVPYPNGIPMPAQTVMFIENEKYKNPQAIYLLPQDLKRIKIKKETIIIPMKYDKNLFNELSRQFPKGKIKEKNKFCVYKIK